MEFQVQVPQRQIKLSVSEAMATPRPPHLLCTRDPIMVTLTKGMSSCLD